MSRTVTVHDGPVYVIDGYLARPGAVLEEALAHAYAYDGTYPGERSPVREHDAAEAAFFEEFIGKPVTRLASVFQLQPAAYEARCFVHVDLADWAAVLYLNRDHAGEPGTRFYRHRATGLARFRPRPGGPLSPHVEDGADPARWDVTLTVPIRFNRLVLYEAALFHRNASAWGTDARDARLVQSFFMLTDPSEVPPPPKWMREDG